MAGTLFKSGVVTSDGMSIVVIGADKGSRDAIFVFHARTGSLLNKIPLKQSASKVQSHYSFGCSRTDKLLGKKTCSHQLLIILLDNNPLVSVYMVPTQPFTEWV
jgi:hypothetical protein